MEVPETDTVCPWAANDPLYRLYHDTEWGIPQHDDSKLFELLVLEGMQAGLSWLTVLRKRDHFRQAFDHFDPRLVAEYDETCVSSLMQNAGIVRNQRKIQAAVSNARAFLDVQREFGSFDRYLWSWVDGKPVINRFQSIEDVPAKTQVSDRISQDLKSRGFKFTGSTICYALMQSAGLVWDHLTSCPCYRHALKEAL